MAAGTATAADDPFGSGGAAATRSTSALRRPAASCGASLSAAGAYKRAGTSPVHARRFWKGRSVFSRATENGPAFLWMFCVCKQAHSEVPALLLQPPHFISPSASGSIGPQRATGGAGWVSAMLLRTVTPPEPACPQTSTQRSAVGRTGVHSAAPCESVTQVVAQRTSRSGQWDYRVFEP